MSRSAPRDPRVPEAGEARPQGACPPPAGWSAREPLGAGSVFVVARVARDGEELACKRLLPRHRALPDARRAIVREARALELAHHPALPSLREVGADEAGPYLLETVVDGLSLREVHDRWGGFIPRPLALHLAREATRVLADLQALADDVGRVELVHGDLGPDNLRMGPDGRIGLLDLGSARFRGFSPDLETGDRGTAPYVAPEVARGEAPPSQASDVYALAATIAWSLLGERAPLAEPLDEAALLVRIGEHGIDPARLDPLPAPLRGAVAACLAFDPARRTSDLAALAAAIDAV